MRGIENQNFPPVYDKYVCTQCERAYLTVQLAEGKTPAMMRCLATEGCMALAISSNHEGGIGLGIPLLVEFVKPDVEDIEKARNFMPMMEGFFNGGGLLRRMVDTAPDWVKALE